MRQPNTTNRERTPAAGIEETARDGVIGPSFAVNWPA